MSPFECAMAATKRPYNYRFLGGQAQFDIDRRLGILDWSGLNIVMARSYLNRSDNEVQGRFGMTKAELQEVIDASDAWHAKAEEEAARRL